MIEGGGDGSVEFVEKSQALFRHNSVSAIRMEESCGERRVDFVKQFEKQQTDAIAVGRQMVAAGMRDLFQQAFGADSEAMAISVPD